MMIGFAQRIDGQDYWRAMQDQSFQTADRGEVRDGLLTIKGRDSDFVKILGEGVSIAALETKLCHFFKSSSAAVIATSDERRGFFLHAYIEETSSTKIEVLQWNQQCNPVERLETLQVVAHLPRTALGKVNKAVLRP
jgi:acyl-coenzyme A synthetase/AMP-(fatty) acid ligase